MIIVHSILRLDDLVYLFAERWRLIQHYGHAGGVVMVDFVYRRVMLILDAGNLSA